MMEESFFFHLNTKFIDTVFFEKRADLEKGRRLPFVKLKESMPIDIAINQPSLSKRIVAQ